MKKRVLTIVLTVILFLSAVALGVSTVFRVDTVAVKATVETADGQSQIQNLQKELEALYDEQSIFSADKEKAEKLLEKYPYLRITEFERSYPNKITFTIVEDTETYAVEAKIGGYYILGKSGIVITHRNEAGEHNVIIRGVQATGKRGYSLTGDSCWQSLLSLCEEMDEALKGLQKNVLSAEIKYRTPETVYAVTMREGVRIYVNNPTVLTKKKAQVAIEKYVGLTDRERMEGRILVVDAKGEVSATYDGTDNFA